MEVYSKSPDYTTNSGLKVSQEDFRVAYQYKQLKPLVKTNAAKTVFYLQPSNMSEGFDEAVQARVENNYNDWQNYMKVVDECYFVRKADDFDDVLFCTCSVGARKQICKHSLVIACTLKIPIFSG
uniref:SWIM-type domain-containing protein n=1 Tax=Panagrolaimus superbus TaxID=310955 RepID=A0A914Y3L3_9BILA